MSSRLVDKTVLLLEGPAAPLWRDLADAFETRGARTLHVRLSLGDLLDWRRPGAIAYRGSLKDWPSWLEALIHREGITDILYYADCLPFHVAAAETAEKVGIAAHTIENGYFRPDWITLERGGMGIRSHFPDDPDEIRRRAEGLPQPDFTVRYRHAFSRLAFHEVVQALLVYFGRPFHPGYVADRYYDTIVELLSWIPRSFVVPRLRRAAAAVESWPTGTPFWLLAMQLQADYQIRANSHWTHLSEMIDRVVTSFAANAAPEDRLVIKLHPHDNLMERWDRVADRIAAARGVEGRVFTILGGDLGLLLERSRGVVLVNSTVGLHTLRAEKPLMALGGAVYVMPGLTHTGTLDDFWTAPEKPDPTLVDAFFRLLGAATQVKGDFYDPAGRAVATAEIADRVLTGRVNQPGGFVDPPPRLAPYRAETERRADASGA